MRREVEPGARAPEVMDDRSLPELLRALLGEGQLLVREEVRLAKAEIREEARKAAKGGAQLGAGGAVAYVALMALAATLVLVGDTFLPAWLSALIVTAIFAAVGWAMIRAGQRRLRTADPARAVDNLKEDGRWAKETMRSVRSSRHAHA